MSEQVTIASMRQVSPEILKELLVLCMTQCDPLMIEGAPGLGKSAIVFDTATEVFLPRYEEYEAVEYNNRPAFRVKDGMTPSPFGVHNEDGVWISSPAPWMMDVRLLLHDPTDAKGLFFIKDGELKCSHPTIIPVRGKVDPRGGVCFLDELPNAPGSTQGAALQPMQDRRIGDHVVENNWTFVGAGNRVNDGTFTNRLSHALGTRFATIIELVCDPQSFIRWGTQTNRISPAIVSFLRRFPQHVQNFDAKSSHASHPNPRVWEKISRYMELPMTPIAQQAFLAGALGDGTATEFLAVIKDVGRCPDPDAIILNPDAVPIPKADDMSVMYMICSALVRKTDKGTLTPIHKWMKKMPVEFQVVFYKDVLEAHPELTMTPEFTDWVATSGHMLT